MLEDPENPRRRLYKVFEHFKHSSWGPETLKVVSQFLLIPFQIFPAR